MSADNLLEISRRNLASKNWPAAGLLWGNEPTMKDETTSCCDRHMSGLTPYEVVLADLLSLTRPVSTHRQVALAEAPGLTLAQDVVARLALPPRDNSAVDGYALGQPDGTNSFRVRSRTAAGETASSEPLGLREADRIFTGAPIPPATFAVVMQEDVSRQNGVIALSVLPSKDAHIRRGGEDIQPGDPLISAGTRLDARHIALLAAMGQAEVCVTSPLQVAIFSSGKELCDPGQELGPAAIQDSNRWMLRALLSGMNVEVCDLGILPDNREMIAQALADAGARADLILGTGGVSVGEEDHIFAALSDVGTAPRQFRMAVKPGKPVVFGPVARALTICLPGNPVAAMVSFGLLVRPCIGAMFGRKESPPMPMPAISGFNWTRKPGRTEYFPGRQNGCSPAGTPILEKLGKGGSALLRPLIAAQGFARVAFETEQVSVGDRIDWFPFEPGFSL